ncbi:hypothetical protein D3C75_1126450 [compost metagenome]
MRWPLAHHRDSARGITSACRQPSGSAHDLNSIVDDGIRVGLKPGERVEHSIDLEIIDRVTT